MTKQTYANYYKEYYQKNKDRIRQMRRERYAHHNKKYYDKAKLEGKALTYTRQWKMWYGAKKRAEKLNLPFNLDFEDIIIPEKCPILGIELNNDYSDRSSAPSLDKIIPSRGYVKGNIKVISMKANTLKSDMTLEIITALRDYIIDSLKEQEETTQLEFLF